MQQVLHLLIVDRKRRAGLASWYGPRWLLPVICCSERTRAAPAVVDWLTAHAIAGDVAGQWLGRVAKDSSAIDWLVVVVASDGAHGIPTAPLRWSSLRSLRCAVSLLDYEQWVMSKTLEHEWPCVAGPFGDLEWIGTTRRWIEHRAAERVLRIAPHRVGAYEVVLEATTGRGPMFFKGLSGDRTAEARVTMELASVSSESFARTIAIEEQPTGALWWLTQACAGTTLARHCSPRSIARVVAACAAVQQRILNASHLVPSLIDLNLETALNWCAELTTSDCRSDELRGAGVPRTWVPLDLDPGNAVVEDDGSVRFIDLDDAYIGPAPLAISVLARRIARRRGSVAGQAAMKDYVYREYDRAWPASRAGVDWSTFESIAAIVEAHLGWRRLSRNAARGEIIGAVDLAAARLKERMTKYAALSS